MITFGRTVHIERINVVLVSIFACVALIGPMSQVLQIASIIISGIILGTILWVNFGAPLLRKRRIKRPCDVIFRIGEDESTNELRVAAHSEVDIQIRVLPRLHYKQNEVIIEFKGLPADRPFVIREFNTFVKIGKKREKGPEDNAAHYLDMHDHYHIRETRQYLRGTYYAYGYRVQTRSSGRYLVRLYFLTDDGESEPRQSLTLVVR